MAEALAIELAASATVTATGSGDAVDLGTRRSAAALVVRTSAFTEVDADPAPSVLIKLQTSAASTGPWREANSVSVTAAGEALISAAGLERYVRATWTLTNMTSIVLSVSGYGHTVYASPSDITRFAVTEAAIVEMTTTQRADALIGATSTAEGYLSSSYEMPIESWDDDLRLNVACLAAVTLFRIRGADPQGPDATVFTAGTAAIQWLDRISQGRLKPPGIVDSTPDSFEGGAYVYSRTPRGW